MERLAQLGNTGKSKAILNILENVKYLLDFHKTIRKMVIIILQYLSIYIAQQYQQYK